MAFSNKLALISIGTEKALGWKRGQTICVRLIMADKLMTDRLSGYRILILETREEAQFSRLLTEQGADVVQCPMFTIHDAPDPAPIEAWIGRFLDKPFDDLVLTTGEGLRRLMRVVRRINLEPAFVAALGKAHKFARGPKPGRALRELGLEPQATTEKPTSEGIAEMLSHIDLRGHRLGLQLYPDKDHSRLIGAITAQGAEVDPVLPYVYDAQAADSNIVTAIDEMAEGRIDAIALTSSGQARRLFDVARAHQCEARLIELDRIVDLLAGRSLAAGHRQDQADLDGVLRTRRRTGQRPDHGSTKRQPRR